METILPILQVAGPALLALLGLGGASQAVRFVQEGERGLKLRFGKVVRHRQGKTPKVVMPGFCWLWPGIEKLRRVHVRNDTINLVDQTITLSDGTVFKCSAVLTFHVEDTPAAVYRILIETADPLRSFADFALGMLRSVLGSKKWEDVIAAERLNSELKDAVRPRGHEWGAVISEFRLTDCRPVEGTATVILATGAALARTDALRKAAEQLGTDAANIPPQLAAALVGVPLVTTLTYDGPALGQSKPQPEPEE